MSEITAKAPWKDQLGEIPFTLDYFQGTMFEAVEKVSKAYPNNVAFDFMGRPTTYAQLVQQVHTVAKALRTIGVREGDHVTIAMPNCPQAIYMF
ncbi:MAG: AMP-binding protein, partial [Lachnospiraceae bacterium]|nr:AMP-binding protein [Lachnospiraceae bacterium]